jgi:hypothetical protein
MRYFTVESWRLHLEKPIPRELIKTKIHSVDLIRGHFCRMKMHLCTVEKLHKVNPIYLQQSL